MTRHECVQRSVGNHPTVARLHRLCDQDREPRQVSPAEVFELRVDGRRVGLRPDGARASVTVGHVAIGGQHALEAMQRVCSFGLLSHPHSLPVVTAGL